MKERKYGKLSLKIVSCCVLLAIVICAASSTFGFLKYKESTQKIYNSFAYDIAYTARSYVNGNKMDQYVKTLEKDSDYVEMAKQINAIYSNSTLTSIYICIPDATAKTITTVYDVRVHTAEKPEFYELGVVDPIGANPEDVLGVYLTGKESSSYFIRSTAYGYNTSAVVPVLSDSDSVTAILVVDVPMQLITTALREYLISAVGSTVVVVALFLVFLLIYLNRNIVSPLKLITAEAASFVENETIVSEKLLTVKTRDEIERLAVSIHEMEQDTNTYIDNLTSVTAEKERIGAELNVATQIQASMLPAVLPWPFPERKEFDLFATMDPAKEVGGDFYDFFLVDDDHLAVVIGDVSGKGVPASLFMVIAKTLIKDRALTGATPAENFTMTNELLCEGNGGGLFVTGWMGVYEFSTHKLTYVNAGHNPPLIRRGGGKFEYLKSRAGFVLAGMEGMRYKQFELELQPGDTLMLYTDGVTEATSRQEELFGEQRLADVLNAEPDAAPAKMLEAVKAGIDGFVKDAPQFDDITMLALKIKK